MAQLGARLHGMQKVVGSNPTRSTRVLVGMRNTTGIGNVTQAMVLAALARAGKNVLVPFGEGLRYDLVIEENGRFLRVQCKTGKLKAGIVVFRNYSTGYKNVGHPYGKDVDAYGVYCPQTQQVYFVPASECAGTFTSLRITKARNGQSARMASSYVI